MFLTREEEAILDGEEGAGKQRAMELLVALGKIYSAERLIPITSSHLSGVSYKTIGEGGLDFLNEISREAHVSVKTTLNPAGMDLERWEEMGISRRFAEKQLQIIECYRRMGVETVCTCTPYLHHNVPEKGDSVSWAESSAISYVNSVIGARTNREGGPAALAAAVLGRTPLYGLHIKENRAPTIIVKANIQDDPFSYSLLGYIVGKEFGNAVPYFQGISGDSDRLKTLAAAMAASGAVAMFHVEGITPESGDFDLGGLDTVSFDQKDLMEAREKLTSGHDPDLIAIGCPHLSISEIKEIAHFLKGKKKNSDIDVWFCTNRYIASRCRSEVEILEQFGRVICDTCMVVTPIEERYMCTATSSAKACSYLPGLCSQRVFCDSTIKLLEMIV